MFNEFDDEMIERNLDEDIELRKSLIASAKALQTSEDKNVYLEVSKLQKEWRKIPSMDSALEADLKEEFDTIVDSIYAKRKSEYKDNETVKKDLITQAKALVKAENWNKATAQMEELMEQWRTAGSTGKESDDSLWEEFNEARKDFFNNKHQYWEDLQAKFANAKEVKQDLIVKAKELQQSEEWNKTSAAFQDLLDQWKAVGNAGKEFEEKLWSEFNEVRQGFYDRRNAYYEELHEKQGVNATSKRDLITKAQEISNSKEYTKENTEAMKQISASWKTVGNSGKEEDGLWAEFRGAMDSYFDGLRTFNEQRQAQWRQRMQEIRARKQEMIMKQKNQIKRLQEEMASMYSQREIDDTIDYIEEKKEFIEQLESEIADIESKLNK